MASGQPKLLPFRSGTRQRRAKVGAIAHTAASALTPLELPRVGLLSRILVQFRGTVTFSAGGAFTDQGPWNLGARIKVNTNIGTASIVDVSGYGAYMIQPVVAEDPGWRPDMSGLGSAIGTTNADVFTAPLGAGAQTWALPFVIPIGANSGNQFETGLINLQAPETRVTVEITAGALTDPASNITATTGNWHVYYEYYEIPDPRSFALPPLALVRWLEEQQAVGQTGDNVYTVPRQGVLLNLLHRLTLNGARSDSFDSTTIRFNKTDSVYQEERQYGRVLERQWYGLNPLVGVIYHDLWHANNSIAQGDTRDAIDAEELSTLESIVTVSSGAVLGSNNNFLASVRRIAQVLE